MNNSSIVRCYFEAKAACSRIKFARCRRRHMRSNLSALGSITILRKHERQAARPPSSFLSALATIFSELSESGLCSLSASSAGAFIQTPISSRAVRTTGIAFGWIAPQPRCSARSSENAKISFVVSPSFTFRTEVQRVQMPPVGIQSKLQF
jgi:hypothetical protein